MSGLVPKGSLEEDRGDKSWVQGDWLREIGIYAGWRSFFSQPENRYGPLKERVCNARKLVRSLVRGNCARFAFCEERQVEMGASEV